MEQADTSCASVLRSLGFCLQFYTSHTRTPYWQIPPLISSKLSVTSLFRHGLIFLVGCYSCCVTGRTPRLQKFAPIISQGYFPKQLLLLLHPISGLYSRTTCVSRHQKGKTSLDLNEARDDGVWGWQWHQLDHMQTVCTSLQTDNHTNTSSLSFYRPDAHPEAQPTVSKH